MTDLLETLASYVPSLVVQRLVVDPSPPTQPMEDRLVAALVFADFSGFTTLAETLAQQGPEGAEELNSFLNSKFDELINLITVLGGDVVTFAGDALLALWPVTNEPAATMTLRAAQCSLALQEMFRDEAPESPIHLDIRMGIGVGPVRIVYIGGVYERWVWLVSGEAVTQVLAVEQQAQPGQVVLSPEAWDMIHTSCEGCPVGQENGSRQYQERLRTAELCTTHSGANHRAPGILLQSLLQPAPLNFSLPLRLHTSMETALRSYIPDVVLTRLAARQGGWLAELRLITVLFINLPEMGSTHMTLDQIQAGVRSLQTALYHYEGSVNKFSVDEKGVTLIAVFGLPPLSHEDDAARGLLAALAVKEELTSAGLSCSIGVTTGRAFCGAVGNDRRREYTILGDIVNLAARLMQAAAGDILCDAATSQSAQNRLVCDVLSPIMVKGKTDPIPIYRPRGLAELVIRPQSAIVGRAEERALLSTHLHHLRRRKIGGVHRGEATVVFLEGEAGMGKSRLLDDLRAHATPLGLPLLMGMGDAVEHSTPYYAWRRIFSHILALDMLQSQEERQQHVLDQLADEPTMFEQAALLNAVLPLELPESRETAQLTGHALADATRTFLLQVLQLHIARAPALLILENAQWLDTASWSLLLVVCQHIPSLLVVVATRPMVEPLPEGYRRLYLSTTTRHMRLEPLLLEGTLALICQRLGAGRVPEAVAALIHEKSQGNPLFIEEMTYALRDTGQIIVKDGVCWISPTANDLQDLRLPDTVHGVITSRIDRLTPEQQLSLKVASVIGHTFAYRMLLAIYPMEIDEQELVHNLASLERLELIQQDEQAAERTYRFRHVMTQEVVYELMPFAQRRPLHRTVAEWYVRAYPDTLDELAPLLALHFAHADDARAQQYYTLAGNVAFHLYANTEAIEHFSHAIESAMRHKAPGHQLLYLYTRRGRAMEIEAEYTLALENYQELDSLADAHHDPEMKLAALMSLATLRSTPNPTFDPHQAEVLLGQALGLARRLEDRMAESKALWNLMLLKVFSGIEPEQAIIYGEQSLALARAFHQHEQIAFTLNDLSMAYRNRGQLKRSLEVLEEASDIWRSLGNLPMLADSLSRSSLGHYLGGNYEQAIDFSEEARHICESIGNSAGHANSQFMIGHVYMERGEPDCAIETMREAIYLGEQVGHLAVQIGTRADLGWIYGVFGDVEHGLVLAELAYARSEEHNNIFRPWVLAVLARLLILKGDLAEAGRAIQAGYASLREKNETILAPIYMPLAEAELALVHLEYARVIAVAEQLLNYLHTHEIRPFASDALYLKGQALMALGQVQSAYVVLQQARADNEAYGSKRMLWQILFLLSHIEARRGNLDEAVLLRRQARSIVAYIAAHAGSTELRDSFLSLPHVHIVAGGGS